mmetsp:Transcript_5219/g.8600  ORF Transcript_5219/g.8600 Transcript_5219/m.8600 type:complete len:265 (+) Transcript_5219:1266-2060(+)
MSVLPRGAYCAELLLQPICFLCESHGRHAADFLVIDSRVRHRRHHRVVRGHHEAQVSRGRILTRRNYLADKSSRVNVKNYFLIRFLLLGGGGLVVYPVEFQILSQASDPPVLRGMIHLDGSQLIFAQLHRQLEPHLRPWPHIIRASNHYSLTIRQQREGLARRHPFRHTHFKHLMIGRGSLQLLLALRRLGKLEGHALVGAHIGRTRHHDFLVVDGHSKLFTWSDVGWNAHDIVVRLLTGRGNYEAVPLPVVIGTTNHHLLAVH